jgi:hypothetical protein
MPGLAIKQPDPDDAPAASSAFVLRVMDVMALRLTECGYVWPAAERAAFERARRLLGGGDGLDAVP